jgi:hypothetical protein
MAIAMAASSFDQAAQTVKPKTALSRFCSYFSSCEI